MPPFGAFPLLLGVALFVFLRFFRRTRRLARNETKKVEELLETKVYRLAAREEGRLTVSDVVVHLGISATIAEKELNRLCDGLRVQMNVEDDGRIVYDFVELKKKAPTRIL